MGKKIKRNNLYGMYMITRLTTIKVFLFSDLVEKITITFHGGSVE